ncbi:CCAAT/enhancer-binding protein zeta [Suncus etruscus]|uniref:CCAAT/enhancer-binding protein zeta n=1 Tax=Suncus etruscus TaxID=109475 RepID=UPI0021107321|nr:CCAAT/enhancer-binding protein zeta [Suncus etruscus]
MAAPRQPAAFYTQHPRRRPEEAVEDPDDDDEDDEADDGFSLEEVLRLGGTKQDYLMLAALDENEEVVDGGKKGAIDDLQQGELETFVRNLNLAKFAKTCSIEEDKDDGGEPAPKQETDKKGKKADKKKPKAVEGEKTPTAKAKTKKKPEPDVTNTEAGAVPPGRQEKQPDPFEFCARQTLLLKPGGKWHELEYSGEFCLEPQLPELVAGYRTLAQRLYEHEISLYQAQTPHQKGTATWMKAIVSAGTLGDRLAAMTLLIQDDAVHTLGLLETLVNLVKKKGSKQQCLLALDTAKELLLTHLLPDSRKLRPFTQRPLGRLEQLCSGNRDARDRRLLLWHFEHQLKHLVAEFVQVLDTLGHDALVATKTRALSAAHELLCHKPEQEKALLGQLVNKLGDPLNRVAARASHLLETLLRQHPNMKGVVCSEVERLLFRAHISPKAQYYAVCFLGQTALSPDDGSLASRLITVYFCFFRTCVKQKDLDSKMLGALLTGVNRAYPYAPADDDKVREQVDTLFRVVHAVNFSTGVQALMLLFQVMNSQQTISDRYYAALYRKMLDPGLLTCSKPALFLNLIYKSLKADVVLRRVRAFIKRLLQVVCGQMPPFACGALFLVSEILKAKPALRSQLDLTEADDEEKFVDLGDEEDTEHFTDADKEAEAEAAVKAGETAPGEQIEPEKAGSASWVHVDNLKGGTRLNRYDPFSRNPLFCGAENTSLWELKKLSEHYHPSVALFAKTILEGNSIQYSGDPLQDFTLMRFLDRFVYRNPKPHKGKENTDSVVMQPKRKHFLSDVHTLPVNSREFLAREESQIPAHEVFFHRYYKKVAVKQKQRQNSDEESIEDVDDDEFERMIDTFEDDNCFSAGKDDLDFASNVKKKKQGAKGAPEDEDSEASEDVDDLDDDEVSLGSLGEEEFSELGEDGGTFMDASEEDEEEDEDDEGGKPQETAQLVSRKKGKRKGPRDFDIAGSFQGPKKKKKGFDDSSLFVSAEEFGHLLDENVGSKFDNIGLNAMANKDNASFKQLRWEAERDDWLHDRDPKSIIRRKKNFRRRPRVAHKAGKQKKTGFAKERARLTSNSCR